MLSSPMWLVAAIRSNMGLEYSHHCRMFSWKIWCGVMNWGVVSIRIVLKIRALDEIT